MMRFLRSPLGIACVFAACSPVGGGRPPTPEVLPDAPTYPDVAGPWTGYVSLEDQGLQGTLHIEQDGPTLDVVFVAPALELRATGDGSVSEVGKVVIALAYDLQCPGSAVLQGRRSDDGLVIDGVLTATDCTGSIEGNFSFRR